MSDTPLKWINAKNGPPKGTYAFLLGGHQTCDHGSWDNGNEPTMGRWDGSGWDVSGADSYQPDYYCPISIDVKNLYDID